MRKQRTDVVALVVVAKFLNTFQKPLLPLKKPKMDVFFLTMLWCWSLRITRHANNTAIPKWISILACNCFWNGKLLTQKKWENTLGKHRQMDAVPPHPCAISALHTHIILYFSKVLRSLRNGNLISPVLTMLVKHGILSWIWPGSHLDNFLMSRIR